MLKDGRTIPMSRSLLNSALAATNFSGERRRDRGKTGRPSVTLGSLRYRRFRGDGDVKNE